MLSFSKEAVNLGIDEIQFDYVRFPDNMYHELDGIDMKNQYGESKSQAIQHFLYYAREELRLVEEYLSADVFGWNMICGDDQDIGQFIPAIATVVDAISPMPYPDHFGEYSFGIAKSWQAPGMLLEAFTKKSVEVLNSVESPAIYRTWIQGYPCLEWVCQGTTDNPYRGYGPDEIVEQINGTTLEMLAKLGISFGLEMVVRICLSGENVDLLNSKFNRNFRVSMISNLLLSFLETQTMKF